MGQQDSISPIQRGTLPLRLLAATVAAVTLFLARPALAVEWQTYLKEDFSEEKSMFYTGQAGEAFYRIDPDGRYIIDGLETASDSLSALTDKLYYYYAEASCEVLESSAGDLAFCGVIFHYHKTGDGQLAYYVFYTYGDGYYGAKRVEGEQSDIIIPLAKSSLVNAQGGNILGVDAQGSRFDLYINGIYADGFTDTGVDGGGFGFYVSKHSLGAFDDFIVRIEKRAGGRETPEAPSVAEGGEGPAKDYFDGYHPPEIPRDPDRPLYPWEVGYDKSQKARKKKAEGEEGRSVKAPEQKGPKESRPGARAEKKETQDSPPAEESKDGGGEPVKEGRPPKAESAEPEPVPSEHGRDKEARPGSKLPADAAAPPEDDSADPADAAAPGAEEAGRHEAAAAADPDAGKLAEDSPVEEASPSEGPVVLAAEETASEPELSFALDAGAPPAVEPAGKEPSASYEKPSANPDGSLAPGKDTQGSPDDAAEAAPKGTDAEELSAKADEAPPPAKEKAKRRTINIREDDWETSRAAPMPPATKPPQPAPAPAAEPQPEAILPAEDDPARTALVKPEAEAAIAIPAEDPQVQASTEARPEEEPEPSGTALSELTGKSSPAQQHEPQATEARPEAEAEAAEASASGGAAERPGAEADATPVDSPPLPRVEPPLQSPPAAQEEGSLPADAAAGPEAPASEAPQDPAGPPANPYYGGASEDTPLSELLPDYLPPSPADTPLSALLGESGGAEMDELPMPLAPTDSLADGAPGLVKLDDSFDTQRWPVSQSATASYAYLNGRYNIDNQHAETMAISYQEDNLRDCALAVEALGSGDPAAGFGLAARFQLNGGSISYYGLFLSEAGDFLLLKVLNGKEYVLRDWSPAPERSGNAAWRLGLECRGSEIRVLINGRLCATLEDSDIASGGYALLGGPGAGASFDNFSLRGQR